MSRGELTSNNFSKVFFDSLFSRLNQLKLLNCLHLHVYGNGMSKSDVVDVLKQVAELRLSKFLFSFMEFLIQDVDCIEGEVLDAFEALDVVDKTIC